MPYAMTYETGDNSKEFYRRIMDWRKIAFSKFIQLLVKVLLAYSYLDPLN